MEISVVIPTYNRAHTLSRAISCVLNQTYLPKEIIVVDDGSTDNTQVLVLNHYPVVKYHAQENHGVSHARNTGIKLAKYPWVAFLDSDDAWTAEKLEKQVSKLTQTGDKLCHTDEIWYRDGVRINQQKKHQKRGGFIFEHCLPLCCISPSSVLVEKDFIETVGLFDETLPACEDYDLWLRICAHHRVSFVDEPLTIKHGGHDDQLSKRYWGMDRFRIQALEKCLKDKALHPEYRMAAQKMLQEKIAIFLTGARKRENHEDVKHYETLLTQYA